MSHKIRESNQIQSSNIFKNLVNEERIGFVSSEENKIKHGKILALTFFVILNKL